MKTVTHETPYGTKSFLSDEPQFCWIDTISGDDSGDGSPEYPVLTRYEAAGRLPGGREILISEHLARMVPADIPPLTRQMPYEIGNLVCEAIAEGSSWEELDDIVDLTPNTAAPCEKILLLRHVHGRLVIPLMEALKPFSGKHVCFIARNWQNVPEEYRPGYVPREELLLETANKQPAGIKSCPRCDGSGYDPHSQSPDADPCLDCDGSGKERDWAAYWHDYDERYGIR